MIQINLAAIGSWAGGAAIVLLLMMAVINKNNSQRLQLSAIVALLAMAMITAAQAVHYLLQLLIGAMA